MLQILYIVSEHGNVMNRKLDRHKKYDSLCPRCGVSCGKRRMSFLARLCQSCAASEVQTGNAGSLNRNWRGGRTKTSSGYVALYSPNHPRAHKSYVLEHILVAELSLGRRLAVDEVVHHQNGIKDDNRAENLKVMTRDEHAHHHNGFAKLYPCRKCGRMTDNKKFCSMACRAKIVWPSREWILSELREHTLTDIAKRLGVARQNISAKFNIYPRRDNLF